jgi:hypothetical protein
VVVGVCLKCIGLWESHYNIQMEVAVRKPSKGPSIALWRHEFYGVNASKPRLKALKTDVDIYQTLEFRKGVRFA